MKNNIKKVISVAGVLVVSISLLAACTTPGAPLTGYTSSDMSGYACLEGYESELKFVDMTVKDVQKEMKNKSSFVLYTGYANCPWCNVMLTYLNDAAVETDSVIGYIDTRRDPEWKSNTDIADYDIFTELFDEYLELDEEGVKHLYVPDVYFIKDGEVVSRHSGTASGQQSPEDELTQEQKDELKEIFKEGFEKIK